MNAHELRMTLKNDEKIPKTMAKKTIVILVLFFAVYEQKIFHIRKSNEYFPNISTKNSP